MAITVQQALRHIEHTLGGELDPLVPGIELINHAGEYLVSMTGWRWLTEGTATLDLVGGQEWVALPSDFKTLGPITGSQSTRYAVQIVTKSELLEWRTYTPGVGGIWKVALETTSAATGGPVTWRLSVAPTPVTSETGALTLFYERGWGRVSESSDQLSLPRYCELLYLQVLRAFARGFEEEETGSLDRRLAEVRVGPMFEAAKLADTSAQPHSGVLRGGLGQEAQTFNAHFWREGSSVTLG